MAGTGHLFLDGGAHLHLLLILTVICLLLNLFLHAHSQDIGPMKKADGCKSIRDENHHGEKMNFSHSPTPSPPCIPYLDPLPPFFTHFPPIASPSVDASPTLHQ
eukprot:GHVS01055879.1.p1 GENE.GHVS01055879.1~~GHVS01055879.1.p1  ORF type:complete len:104 (-),score=14.91 GHVS01055879.1:53-364(-)